MSTGTNRERIEQNNTLLEDIKTQIQNLPEAGGSGDIKLFATVEEMKADANAKEGDLAIVYRSEVKNATVDSKFQVAAFPDTVVLDTAITDYVEVRYRAVDSSIMFECMGQLDSSNFIMDCYTETGNIRIQYTSSDGITYTRTDSTGNPVDFGCEIYYAYTEMWNDAIGKFIQYNGSTFTGLYKYTSEPSKYSVNTISNPVINDNTLSGNYEYVNVQKLVDNLFTVIPSLQYSSQNFAVLYIDENHYDIIQCYNYPLIMKYDTNWYFINGLNSATGTIYHVNFEDNTYTEESMELINDGNTNYYPVDVSALKMFGIQISSDVSLSFINFKYDYDSTEISFYSDYEPVYKYYIAPTQLTLTNSNELLSGKIGYGKDGVITGNINKYDKLNTSIGLTSYDLPDGAYFNSKITVDTSEVSKNNTKLLTGYEKEYNRNADTPYKFYAGTLINVGNLLHMFGTSTSGYETKHYIYNTDTDTYAFIDTIPIQWYGGIGCYCEIDNCIYLFGSGYGPSTRKLAYKYNIENKTYTKLTDMPYQSPYACTIYNTDVYIFGFDGNKTKAVKYDTLTDKYTSLPDIPDAPSDECNMPIIDNIIYVLSSTNAYTYNVDTQEITELPVMPYSHIFVKTIAIGTDIYILGGNTGYYNYNYKFDTLTKTYTKNNNIPYSFGRASKACAVGENIYLLGADYSASNSAKLYNYLYVPKYIGHLDVTEQQNALMEEKNTNLLPENIKAGVTIFGITGAMEIGIDTSDANATSSDIANNKTAYVNGEKITGELPEYNSSNQVTLTAITSNNFIEDTSYVSASAEVSITPGILRSALGAKLRFQKSGLRSAIGLTADKIKVGETILGVEGTYDSETGIDTSDATATAEQLPDGITAYVNGEKITGTAVWYNSSHEFSKYALVVTQSGTDINIDVPISSNAFIEAGNMLHILCTSEQLIEAIGLTADKIKKGETILGITGTYEGEGAISQEEYSTAINTANDILGEEV